MSIGDRLRVQLWIPANNGITVAGGEVCSLSIRRKGREKGPDFENRIAAAVLPRESLTVAFILNPFDRDPGGSVAGFRRTSWVAGGLDAFTGGADVPMQPLFAVHCEELILFRTSEQRFEEAFANRRKIEPVPWWRLSRGTDADMFIELTEWLGACLTYAASEDNFELFGSESAMLMALRQLEEAFDERA